ncbi:MAG: PA0069 family radical SAM protein [Planctomycetes bacterium]|nr:PA0069 family radical SAM protein [Planctomycetota bacterium]
MQRRGTDLNPTNRFERISTVVDEYCDPDLDLDGSVRTVRTEWFWDDTKTIVAENESPDIPFRYSINPYRGCEHGCAYCYARPYHEYLGWNAGTDFETKILVKSNAADLLRDWLSRPAWSGQDHLNLSGVTDPYQPIERKLEITRSILQVLCEARQAVSIITKNALITRDIDLLADLARDRASAVVLSITSLDKSLAMVLEPRCSVPEARLRAVRELTNAGIPVHVNIAPIIPGLNDQELPSLMAAIAEAGAKSASWTLLRLPGAVEKIFEAWLDRHQPLAKEKILNRIRALRGGELHDSQFGRRMRGEGFFADQWTKLAEICRTKHSLAHRLEPLNTSAYRPPASSAGQRYLF